MSAASRIPGDFKGWLHSAGTTQKQENVVLPRCPNGFEGHYLDIPQYQSTGWAVSIENGRADPFKKGGDYFVPAYNHVHSPDLTIYTRSYYLTFCLPAGEWKPISYGSRSDSQCTESWRDYNGSNGCYIP